MSEPSGRATSAAAAPFPFYHGWVMLVIAIGMAFSTMPGQTVLVSLWKEPLRAELGLSLTQVSAAYSIATIIAALPLSFIGRAADRFGLRRTVGCITVLFIFTLVLLREATGIVTLGLGFFAVRLLGQGSLSMLSGHTIAMWFERKLGRVHSLLGFFGFAAGSALMPLPTAWMIKHFGWQHTLLALAALVALLILPGLLLFFRNRPEDIGQHLDGDPVEHDHHDVAHGGQAPVNDPAFTRAESMRTPAFWILTLTMATAGFIGTALLFHMPAMLEQAGLEGTEQQAALAIQPWPIVLGIGTLCVGWLVDRFHAARLLPIGLVLMAIGTLLCVAATRGMVEERFIIPLMATGMAVFGACHAVIAGVVNPTIARYFGRTHHGAIRGTVATASVMGTGAATYIVALGRDLAGNDFTIVYLVCAAMTIPLGIGAATLRQPHRMSADSSS